MTDIVQMLTDRNFLLKMHTEYWHGTSPCDDGLSQHLAAQGPHQGVVSAAVDTVITRSWLCSIGALPRHLINHAKQNARHM